MSTAEMDAWVTRLLGVAIARDGGARDGKAARPLDLRPAGGAARPVRFVSVEGRARWADARERVDAQVGKLMTRLENSDNADLRRVADLGFAALTRNLNTALLASLTDVDAARPDQADAARTRALKAVADMRSLIGADPLVALMDDNAVGVPVNIRGTLGDALRQIEEALA